MHEDRDGAATPKLIPARRSRGAGVGLGCLLAALGVLSTSCRGESPEGGKALEYQPAPPESATAAAPQTDTASAPADVRAGEGAAAKPNPAAPRQAEAGPAGDTAAGPVAQAGEVQPPQKKIEPRDESEPLDERGPVPLGQFVRMEPGTFRMGYADGGAGQQPVHGVTLSRAFYIQRTEVTQGQWRAVMGANPSHNSACGDDCPVEQVSWHDAQRFIEALNAMVPGARYRLPTEAEWEYAARAGAAGGLADAEALADAGWFEGNAGGRSHPTGRKLPNPRGLFDVHGNVAEWVSDFYLADYYRLSPELDPPGPPHGPNRVVRGGSWGSASRFVGALGRVDKDPFTRDFSIGFRLARDP